MARTPWLSQGAEKLTFHLLEQASRKTHCDVVVVGSGYGGAVAAARLAGAREEGRLIDVWVLERGREFVPGAFPERFADLPGEVRIGSADARQTRGLREGLFDLRIGENVSALLANGLGGGSLINAGVLARPAASVFQRSQWPRAFRAPHALDVCFSRAEKMLGAQELPGRTPAKLAALTELATRFQGVKSERAKIAVTLKDGRNALGVEQRGCIHCGDCFTGCNHAAKNTLAMNYLPLAWRLGARLFTGVTVLSLAGADGAWELELDFTDLAIRKRFGEALPRLRAKRVILAAGAYGSTGILLRSKKGGFRALSANRLGENFSTNGDMIAVGYRMPGTVNASGEEAEAPGKRAIGPTITGMIDLRGRRTPFVIEELAIPAALRRAFEETVTTFGLLHELERIDWSDHSSAPSRDPAAIDAGAVARTAVYATIGDDGAAGTMKLGKSRNSNGQKEAERDDDIGIEWPEVAKSPVFVKAMAALERAHRGRATVIPNPMWRVLPPKMAKVLDGGDAGGAVLTVHPLGGCAMADWAENGVVNDLGQVFSSDHGTGVHETLAVLDGAIVPTALGTNPCLTIAALAEHAVEGLAREWGLTLADDSPEAVAALPTLEPPVLGKKQPAEPARPTAMRLAERLTGALRLAGTEFQAELELEYDEIPDLERFLSAPQKILRIDKKNARLLLRGEVNGVRTATTVRLEGELRLLERAGTTVFERVWTAGRAWFANRGKREMSAGPLHWIKYLGLIRGWVAVASHAGERRYMTYRLKVLPGEQAALVDGTPLLRPGDVLTGRKIIAYTSGPDTDQKWRSLWDQLTKLPLSLEGAKEPDLGVLEVDLPYFVQQYATQLQVGSQENQPRALADLFSFLAYVARVVGKIHFWSLRAPDYPNPYPVYEFDEAERQKAAEAAAGAGRDVENRRLMRLPGPIPGLCRQVIPLDGRDHPAAPQGPCLTHYTKIGAARASRGPVLLIHGLGASGNTFTLTTVDKNLVEHLIDEDFDPWVLDLRTSIGLRNSKRDWSFEDVADNDIPEAIRRVRAKTGSPTVDVMAHCIGAAMFCMAALRGRLEPRSVRSAVLSQVGPLIELPPTNRFRGYIASYLKHYLDIGELDTAASLTLFNRFLDRVLGLLPYPKHEWNVHLQEDAGQHEAFCLRCYGIYGRLFEHHHLNAATLNRLGDYLGHIRYKTYQQTIYYATMRRLTDESGANLVTHDKVDAYLAFPLCFLHGDRNEVFDKRTSERSFDLLASMFWSKDLEALWMMDPGKRYDYDTYKDGRRLRIVEVEGYGHQDCMLGKDAHIKVYPEISRFLKECSASERVTKSLIVVRPPRLGPMLGWVRESDTGDALVARILFAPNESRSKPVFAMSIVLRDGAWESGKQRAHFHELQSDDQAPTREIDIRLPKEDVDLNVVVVTLHKEYFEPEPEKEGREDKVDDPFGEDLDRFPWPAIDPDFAGKDPDEYAERVLRTCKDLAVRDGKYVPMPTGKRVNHKRYATPVSTVAISPAVLRAARKDLPGGELRFALASCRYTATVADREAADGSFGRLRDLVLAQPDSAPQMLFLAGDSIYADATYGIFDPEDPKNRFDQRYLEAWTAPNARELLRRLPTYPMLDDHEVQENFEGKSPEYAGGFAAFEAFQLRLTPCDKSRAKVDKEGYCYDFGAGGFKFFVADTRTGRERHPGASSWNATIIPHGQMVKLQEWLRQQHTADPAIPKFIISPSVLAPWSRETRGHRAYALRSDAWDGFPVSLHEVLTFIATNSIRNVVFLSGDYHCSVFCWMKLACGRKPPVKAYSIVSSGLYAPYPFANTRFEDLQTSFAGSHAEWLGEKATACCLGSELRIKYRAHPIATRGTFALVHATRSNGGYKMTVCFDREVGTGARRIRPIELELR